MDFDKKIDQITKLSQRIQAQEPPAFIIHERQAAITTAELEKTITDLIMEKMSVKIIFLSLFYFWLRLEAPLREVSEQQVDQWSMPLEEAMKRILYVIKSVVDSLPNHEPTSDMKKLGKNVNALKAYLSDELFDHPSLPDELVKQSTSVNTRIHTVTSNLLRQSIHPEIVSNVLFSRWLRISTLHEYVSEKYYQKMEFYFSEIIDGARKQVPILFNHRDKITAGG